MSSFVLGGEQLVERHVPALKRWFDKRFTEHSRHRAFRGLSLAAVFLAGFLAWWDENSLRVTAQSTGLVTSGKLEQATSELERARAEVARLQRLPGNQELATLRDELTKIRKSQAARRLSEHQKTALVALLAGLPPQDVFVRINPNGEAIALGGDIIDALKRAGWKAHGTALQGIRLGEGLWVTYPEDREPGRLLAMALRDVGLEVDDDTGSADSRSVGRIGENQLWVQVGDKPHMQPETE